MGRAGNQGRLNIVIYERGSAFDLAITSGIRPGSLMSLGGVGENGTMMINSSASSGRID